MSNRRLPIEIRSFIELKIHYSGTFDLMSFHHFLAKLFAHYGFCVFGIPLTSSKHNDDDVDDGSNVRPAKLQGENENEA